MSKFDDLLRQYPISHFIRSGHEYFTVSNQELRMVRTGSYVLIRNVDFENIKIQVSKYRIQITTKDGYETDRTMFMVNRETYLVDMHDEKTFYGPTVENIVTYGPGVNEMTLTTWRHDVHIIAYQEDYKGPYVDDTGTGKACNLTIGVMLMALVAGAVQLLL